jgi:hypothetical protein
MTLYSFKFGDFFRDDDVVAEWVTALSMASNDIRLLQDRLDADEEERHRWFYWFRVTVAHAFEAIKYLERTSQRDEIHAFIDRLPQEVQGHHADALRRFGELHRTMRTIRDEVTFHYPEMKHQQRQKKKRPIQAALARLKDSYAIVDAGEAHTIGSSRHLFADDVAASVVMSSVGGWNELMSAWHDIRHLIASFMRFTNRAVDEFLAEGHERGGEWAIKRT